MAARIFDSDNIINVDDTGVPVHQFSTMSIDEFAFFSQDEPIDDYFNYLEQDNDDKRSDQMIIDNDDIILDNSSNEHIVEKVLDHRFNKKVNFYFCVLLNVLNILNVITF